MANMSYCRWQNTYTDLRDCASDLEERMSDPDENEPLSADERSAMRETFELMVAMFAQLGVGFEVDEIDIGDALEGVK